MLLLVSPLLHLSLAHKHPSAPPTKVSNMVFGAASLCADLALAWKPPSANSNGLPLALEVPYGTFCNTSMDNLLV